MDKRMTFLGWTDKGMVLAGSVLHVGDVEKTRYLTDAEKLGALLR